MKNLLTISLILNIVLLYFILTKKPLKLINSPENVPTNKHIIVYGTMKCGYTVKLLEELSSNNVNYTFVDTSTPKGNEEYSKYKVRGVPLTVCTNNNKKAVGYMPVKTLMKKLGYN